MNNTERFDLIIKMIDNLNEQIEANSNKINLIKDYLMKY